jgi:putative endonuclease
MIRTPEGCLYTGTTTDYIRRLAEHQSDTPKAAKYLRNKNPLTLVYTEPAISRSQALKRESQIKKMSKQQKEALIDQKTSQ